ncbi:hypothetical protein ACQZ5N_01025 [Agrobacterium sp. 22-221-1]
MRHKAVAASLTKYAGILTCLVAVTYLTTMKAASNAVDSAMADHRQQIIAAVDKPISQLEAKLAQLESRLNNMHARDLAASR